MWTRWLFNPYAAGALSAGSALVAAWLLRGTALPQASRVLVALLPVPFFLLFIAAELVWIRRTDEFHRRVLLDSLAIAFPAGIALGIAVEGLQRAGFLSEWRIGEFWPLMGLLFIPALLLSYKRYR
jgi:hypothetical protein